MTLKYNDPANGTKSGIDKGGNANQMNTYLWDRAALVEAQKEMYFMPLADTKTMPKHYGKEIRVYHYMPLLDDRNVNDQGIDASGATIVNGNLYGSSKDIGLIESKLPTLTESGGRVNRVGFTRLELKGTMRKFGMFHEFTQESLDFDSDADLYQHMSRELMTGAVQLSEAILQKELLAGAGVIVYAGDATTNSEITAEPTGGAVISELSYENFSRVNRILNDNRTPKQTKVIKGSRMIDTRTINAGRIAYMGSELEATVRAMTDTHGDPAFVSIEKYADAGNILNGEIGTVGQFRIVVVPEMLHWAGVGGTVTANPGYEESNGKYNVYPVLIVGAESFTCIGFQQGGKGDNKFRITTKMPGEKTADRTDPYGETGFSSIKWWHGTMILRSERIALIKTLARI